MQNGFTKKDFQRMFGVARNIFWLWCEELPKDVGIKKTKQTFTPRQIMYIIQTFGVPPFATEQERKYIDLICRANGMQNES